MNAFLYGTALQWKLDLRSRSLLVTCYLVPLIFFALMGSIFVSVTPEMKHTLIQSMTVMGVSMGAFIGLPPSIAETYGGDIKKVYQANGVPLYLGLVSMFISALIHLLIMSVIILLLAPVMFDATLPSDLPRFFAGLAVFIAVSLSAGSVLGLAVKNQAKLMMVSQLIFLPSILLSGIMFPAGLLPQGLQIMGKICPAFWGYRFVSEQGLPFQNMLPLLLIFLAAVLLCGLLLKRQDSN